jgi:Ca-activated chloride channel family protein
VLAASVAFSEEHFDSSYQEGYTQLRSGESQAALDSFLELKTESPDSPLVDYSIASAHYALGMSSLQGDSPDAAKENFEKAKDGFFNLRNHPNSFVQKNVPVNIANCTAQLARGLNPQEQFQERLAGLKQAINEYEIALRLDPENRQAQNNLNHVRFLAKKMLQNPPPEQKPVNEGEGGDEGEQGDEKQEGEDPNQNDNEDSEPQDEDGEESDGEQDQQEGENQNNPNEGDNPEDSSEQGDPIDEENIESILKELEEKSKEEQKNLRKSKEQPRIPSGGKWW